MTQKPDLPIPIYFPFTFISGPLAEIFHHIFGGCVVYQPNCNQIDPHLTQYEQKDLVEIRTPVKGDESVLKNLVKKYKEFGNLHAGEIQTFKTATAADTDEDAFVTQIRSQITKDSTSGHPQHDAVLSARLFLQMAHNFDVQQYEIDHQIQLLDEKKKKMLAVLKGDAVKNKSADQTIYHHDYGVYQTKARLEAWAKLYFEDLEAGPVIITDSQASVDLLLSILQTGHLMCAFDGIPCMEDEKERQKWLHFLCQTVRTPWNGENQTDIEAFAGKDPELYAFKLYIIPGQPPEKLAGAILNQSVSDPGTSHGYINSIIGFLEFKI